MSHMMKFVKIYSKKLVFYYKGFREREKERVKDENISFIILLFSFHTL